MKLSLALSLCMVAAAAAQVPVTVSRATVSGGGVVLLPGFGGSGYVGSALNGGNGTTVNYVTTEGSVMTIPAYMTISSWGGSASPLSYPWPSYPLITESVSPAVIISTNAPGVFTNTLSATAVYALGDHSAGVSPQLTQTFIVTIAENNSGGGIQAPYATLTGQNDPLESVSRNDPSTAVRKLLGFQLTASTNAILTGFAVAISNTTTNGNPVDPISLYRAAAGSQNFDSTSTLLVTTTNTGGYAIFTGLAESINGTNQTYFIAGSFSATNQTRNSFISASLNSQNITATLAGTNAAVLATGGGILGKQYAFLDATVAEDAAYALSLTNGFVSASITNGTLNASSTNGLVSSSYLASALAGVSNISTATGVKSTSFTDSILPAAAAGAAAIGAAFSSDSLKSSELSKDYTPAR